MAGEWIAVDLALDEKPEVQELIDTTGLPVEVVCYRLWKLWGWASMHCEDGTAKMTPPRLCRVCGGSIDFWRAVESVGWLEFDETAATVAVPGWDRRFSQAAKSRLQHRDRAAAQNDREPERRQRQKPACAQAQSLPAPPRSRGEEIREEFPPPPREDAWKTLQSAWNAGPGRPWKPAEPPDGFSDRVQEDGWLDEALAAVGRLGGCRFFKTPPTLIQFVKPGFVQRVMGGQYDEARAERPSGRDDPPKRQLPPDFTAAVRATQAALDAKRREAS